MRSGVIAQKVGMTRIFTDQGEHIPVTVLKLDNVQVIAHRTDDKNGYTALQLGAGKRKPARVVKAERERFAGLAAELASLQGVPRERLLADAGVWKDVAHAVFNLKEFLYIR